MHALRRQMLSSRSTTAWRLLLPLIWLGVAVLCGAMALAGLTGEPDADADGLAALLAPLVWLLLGAALLGLPVLWWWTLRLRRVLTDGASLFVATPQGEATLPFAAVRGIREWRIAHLRAVTIALAPASAAGRRVQFLAPTRGAVPPGQPHPVVVLLRELAAEAQPPRAATPRPATVPAGFGRTHPA